MIIAGVVLLVAIFFVFTRLPEIKEEDMEDDGHGKKIFSLKRISPSACYMGGDCAIFLCGCTGGRRKFLYPVFQVYNGPS